MDVVKYILGDAAVEKGFLNVEMVFFGAKR